MTLFNLDKAIKTVDVDNEVLQTGNHVKTAGGIWVPQAGTDDGYANVQPIGAKDLVIDRVSVTTDSVELKVGATALENRRKLIIRVIGDDAVYVGKSGTVTTTTGFPIIAGESLVIDFDPNATVSIFAIAVTAQSVAIIEVN